MEEGWIQEIVPMTMAIVTAKSFTSENSISDTNDADYVEEEDQDDEEDEVEDLTNVQMITKKVKIEMMDTNEGLPNTEVKASVPEVINLQDEEETCDGSHSYLLTNGENLSTQTGTTMKSGKTNDSVIKTTQRHRRKIMN